MLQGVSFGGDIIGGINHESVVMLTGRTEEGKKRLRICQQCVERGSKNKRRGEGRWNNVDAVEE